jgi:hypothetical protein
MAAPPRSLVENFPNKFIAKYGLEVGFFYIGSVVSCEQTVGADVTAAVTLPPMAVVINRWSVQKAYSEYSSSRQCWMLPHLYTTIGCRCRH